MNIRKCSPWLFFLFLLPLVAKAQFSPQFAPIPGSFGINSPNPVYALDVNYDDIDLNRQAFHLFLPDTSGTFPLVIFIHGGGFTGGSRDVVLGSSGIDDVRYFLERGVAYASIGYRLIASTGADPDGVIKCLTDAKRGLQFIRHFAPELHLKPDKIALAGSSAGAGTSLWLATHPDMADLEAVDPILRASTRVCAVSAGGSQATYDLYKWETEVYDDFDGQGTNFTVDSMINLLGYERYSNFYGGLDSATQILHDPALIQYRQEVDMLFHLSEDDPPFYLASGSRAVHPNQDLFHHSLHAKTILDGAVAANISGVKAVVSALGINTSQGESRNEFLVRELNTCGETTSLARRIVANDLKIFPNPATSQISINLVKEGLIKRVEVFSISGKLLLTEQVGFVSSITVPLHYIKPGIYLVQVTNQDGSKLASKLVVK